MFNNQWFFVISFAHVIIVNIYVIANMDFLFIIIYIQCFLILVNFPFFVINWVIYNLDLLFTPITSWSCKEKGGYSLGDSVMNWNLWVGLNIAFISMYCERSFYDALSKLFLLRTDQKQFYGLMAIMFLGLTKLVIYKSRYRFGMNYTYINCSQCWLW